MHTTRLLLTVLAAIAATATIASSASAATQRYASPTGAGTDCTSAKPCDITEAVENAVSGDEVIVAPGDYPLPDLDAFGEITVRGVPGKPRPRLLFNNGTTPSMHVSDAVLRYVELVHAPGEQGVALGAEDAEIDQVIVSGSAQPSWPAALVRDSIVRNSIVVSPAINGVAVRTEQANGGFAGGTFRNVTAIATGSGGVAIEAWAKVGSEVSVLARNVIARGGPPASGHSFVAKTDSSPGATAKVTVGHSNWPGDDTTFGFNASIVEGAGNQHSAPAFVSAAGGDYRQAPGSPTIDAGLDEAINGAFDVDEDPRQIGGIDIGADEFVVAPAAATGPAGAVTDRSATLSGTVDGRGATTSYRFEYGVTTAYGSTTPAAAAGSGTGMVSAKLDGLSPATTYHYRLAATNSGGTTKGADRTFTTASPPQPTPPPTQTSPPPAPAQQLPTTAPAPPAQPFAGVELVSRRLTYARRAITVRLSCPVGTVGRCSGRTKLTARPRRTSARRVTLGRARFSIAAGTQAKVRVRVSRAGGRVLRRVPRLRARAVTVARDAAGQSKTTRAAVTIRRRHR